MNRLMVTGGGGNLEASSADIVMFCKKCGLKCSLRGLWRRLVIPPLT
jgi:hypothetical protein